MRRAARGAAFIFWVLPSASLAALQQPSYMPASACAACHVETYASWSRTFHALAAIDPVFVEALERTDVSGNQRTRGLCLTCHSPTSAGTGDFELSDPVSKEGVTCSFCHSVTSVDLEARRDRFTTDPSRIFTAEGPAAGNHRFENQELLLSAQFCAGCHEWVNRHGLRILGTYSEWKESGFAAENIPCQRCHMPASAGDSVERDKAKAIRATNVHFQMGGHSQDQLVSAARLEAKADVRGREIHLDVEVTNAEAGHMLPTGLPNRKLKLLVDLYDRQGELIERRTQTFSRIIANEQGRILEDVTDQFLHGTRELADNRIAPKETRRELIVFDRPAGKDFFLVEASLEYDIFIPYLVPPVLNFKIVTKRLPLTLAGETSGAAPLSLVVLVAGFILVTAVTMALLRERGRRNGSRGRKE